MDNLGAVFVGQLKALRPSFISKEPHFNFITAHCESPVLESISLFRHADILP
jgi:hypothetical protein